MARYKYIDTNPRFLAVDLARQLLPGTRESGVCSARQLVGASPLIAAARLYDDDQEPPTASE